MRTITGPLSVASLVLLLVGFLLWREHKRVELLQAELDVLHRTPAANPPGGRSAVGPRPAPASNREAPKSAVTQTADASESPVLRAINEDERRFRAQISENHRWELLGKKADVIRALNPPPEKMSALKDLLVEREYAERDARDAARKANVNSNDAVASETAKVDARIRALLGEADYARYAELTGVDYYLRMFESTPIPGNLLDAGVPLSPEQRNWIGQLIFRTLGPASPTTGDESAARYAAFRAALLTQSPGNLTPEQIDALHDYFRKQDELDAQMKALIRSRPK